MGIQQQHFMQVFVMFLLCSEMSRWPRFVFCCSSKRTYARTCAIAYQCQVLCKEGAT